jgi:DNA mismatch repair protein MutS2
MEIRDAESVVAIGDVKMTFPRSAITRAAVQGPVSEVPVRGDLPEAQAATEIDVRGMRAGELDEVVLQALDAAIRADLPSLRIIHGKGSGALRGRVAEMLRKDTRVRSFRIGAWNEGGAGVTVAEL